MFDVAREPRPWFSPACAAGSTPFARSNLIPRWKSTAIQSPPCRAGSADLTAASQIREAAILFDPDPRRADKRLEEA